MKQLSMEELIVTFILYKVNIYIYIYICVCVSEEEYGNELRVMDEM